MIRFCVACRTRHPQKHLIPFHRGEENMLLLGIGKRSAWVCANKNCLTHLTQKPNLASRSLKMNGFQANTCLEQVQEKNKCDISKHLYLSQQSGVVFSGRINVLQNQQKIKFLIICCSNSSHSPYILNVIQRFSSKVQIFYLNISPELLGRWIRKGKRKIIGLSQNRHSLQLLNTLQQYKQLR